MTRGENAEYTRSTLRTIVFVIFLHPSFVADTVPADGVWGLPICFSNRQRQQRWAE
jgi:hypothetical protein